MRARETLEEADNRVIARVMGTVSFIVKGAGILLLAYVGFRCATAAYRGESADPRCVFSYPGWIEDYRYGHGTTCVYRPERVEERLKGGGS